MNSFNFTSSEIIPDWIFEFESSIVIQINNLKKEVARGATRGTNLFHVFREFNITKGEQIYLNTKEIINIFMIVTGEKSSNIFGTLGVEGNANLFLINPNGIFFGENANLHLNGSFFGTTANSIVFDNGFEFNSKNIENNPTFRQNFPDGLGFGLNLDTGSGDIVVKGKGHDLKQTFPNVFSEGRTPDLGLQVQPKTSINFIANNIAFESGMATAEGGKIELISVKKGLVTFNPISISNWTINYQKVKQFGDIQLSNRSLLDVSSPENKLNPPSAGFIKLIGGNITITDRSISLLQNRNPQISGNIIVEASNSLILKNNNRPNERGSIFIGGALRSESIENAPGGKISINTPNLFLDNSRITSIAYGNAAGGNIEIITDKLDVINRANITSDTMSKGIGGSIKIMVINKLEITSFFAGIRSNTLGFGNGGNIEIQSHAIKIKDGAKIASTVVATKEARFMDKIFEFNGSGGNVKVKAEILEINGNQSGILENPVVLPTSVVRKSSLESTSYGETQAGNLTLETITLNMNNGGQILGSAFGDGNAADVVIFSSNMTLKNSDILISTEPEMSDLRSSLNLPTLPKGHAGNLELNVNYLQLTNNSKIAAVSPRGLGGSIKIKGYKSNTLAESVSLNINSKIVTNNLTRTNLGTKTIDISTKDLFLNGESEIIEAGLISE